MASTGPVETGPFPVGLAVSCVSHAALGAYSDASDGATADGTEAIGAQPFSAALSELENPLVAAPITLAELVPFTTTVATRATLVIESKTFVMLSMGITPFLEHDGRGRPPVEVAGRGCPLHNQAHTGGHHY